MAPGRSTGLLVRVAAAGVAGLPELELELGPMRALVGSRGSGKSQLLSHLILGGRSSAAQAHT